MDYTLTVKSMGRFNKSLLTHLIFVGVIIFSYCLENPYCPLFKNIGYFSLSGALTNWLAIYMLFEKIPFLYGSGVIVHQFEKFKQEIRTLIMQQFFSEQNISQTLACFPFQVPWDQLADCLNYHTIYQALVEGIKQSSFGKMILMMNGEKTIESLREPVEKRLRQAVQHMLSEKALQQKLLEKFTQPQQFNQLLQQMVDNHLAQLTPQIVKTIIQKMIREHLSWLVVWGGIFGGLIGALVYFI